MSVFLLSNNNKKSTLSIDLISEKYSILCKYNIYKNMQEIFNQAKTILNTLSPKELGSLCSSNIWKRQAIINKILTLLDKEEQNSGNILQAIPIEMLNRWDIVHALLFIDTSIREGNIFWWEVIENVVAVLFSSREGYIVDENIGVTRNITRIIYSLFQTLLSVDIYKNNPKLYLLIWANAEHLWQYDDAIIQYNIAKEIGSVESYLRLAAVYNSRHDFPQWISILDEGYSKHWDISLLHPLIGLLFKDGKWGKAQIQYNELKNKTKKVINPILVYKWIIENDEDLNILEDLLSSYFIEWILEPSTALTELAVSASVYIANQIESESAILAWLNTIPDNTWTDEHSAIYTQAITRRLYLMQNHIITLRDSRYLEYYLDDMNLFGIQWSPANKQVIHDFFENHFSAMVLSEYRQLAWDKNISVHTMDIFEMIRVHIVQISAIFAQWPYHDLIVEKMQPMVNECLKLEWDDEDIMSDVELSYELLPLKDENDFFAILPNWMTKSYEEFIEYFDKNYGIYYRRTIQIFARDLEFKLETYNELFRNNRDIALLFWVEKIMHWWLSDENTEPDMNDIISGYHLDQLGPSDTLLFAAFLSEWESQYEIAIELAINTPGILDLPQALSFITDAVSYLDPAERVDIIKELNRLSRREYAAGDFFKHINHLWIDVIEDPTATNDDISSILLAKAEGLLIRWNIESSIDHFHKASEYETVKSYIKIGDIYQQEWDYDSAIDAFLKSYMANGNLKSISRLINCCITAARFDSAKDYIDIAMRDSHEVSGEIMAYYLAQWKEDKAIKKMIEMIQSNGQLSATFPLWTLELLAETITYILNSPESTLDKNILKILASYVSIQFLTEKNTVDPYMFIEHINYIALLFDQYEWITLYQWIEGSLWFLLDDQLETDNAESYSDRAMQSIHIHGMNIHTQMKHILEIAQKSRDIEKTKRAFNAINALNLSMILMLEKFPDSEKSLLVWRGAYNLLPYEKGDHQKADFHEMPEIVQ